MPTLADTSAGRTPPAASDAASDRPERLGDAPEGLGHLRGVARGSSPGTLLVRDISHVPYNSTAQSADQNDRFSSYFVLIYRPMFLFSTGTGRAGGRANLGRIVVVYDEMPPILLIHARVGVRPNAVMCWLVVVRLAEAVGRRSLEQPDGRAHRSAAHRDRRRDKWPGSHDHPTAPGHGHRAAPRAIFASKPCKRGFLVAIEPFPRSQSEASTLVPPAVLANQHLLRPRSDRKQPPASVSRCCCRPGTAACTSRSRRSRPCHR